MVIATLRFNGRVIMTTEARVLRELRLHAGLSKRKAGDLIRYSDSYISHIENGRTDVPTGARLDKFLNIYGGIKEKSFHERVRRYAECKDPKLELIELIQALPIEKIIILSNLAKAI